MKWLFLRDGSATAFHPPSATGNKRSKKRERRERKALNCSCFMHPNTPSPHPHPPTNTSPPPETHQISTAWLIFCVINLPCLCLYTVVLAAAAIFARSLVEGGYTRVGRGAGWHRHGRKEKKKRGEGGKDRLTGGEGGMGGDQRVRDGVTEGI